mgnify:CR=1 FL=1
MKYYLFLLLFLLSNNLFCQDNFQELDFLFPGDSIPSNTFMLDEVTVYQPLTFENDDEIKIHSILRNKGRNKQVALLAIGKMMLH